MTADLRRPGAARAHGVAILAALALAVVAWAPEALAAAQATTATTVQTTTTPAGTTVTRRTVAKTTRRPVRRHRRVKSASAAAPAEKTETVTTETTATQTRDGKTTETKTVSRTVAIEHKAGDIMSQPARDVGISKLKIPPVLVKARDAPYDLQGLNTCQQLADAVAELTAVIGPDFITGEAWRENRTGKLAEAGGRAVVNSLIPYRGLVREVTGAAPQQRRLDDAVSAAFARRGFLKGVHNGRRCKNAFAADVARENRAIR